ncbi:MAG: hypothetical protein LBC87_07125 [Fibromonadaceae bacterium]|jgi:glucan phosphoethanolaminetransferase (alkaline phosphatase superfamily)|nr:hypothetical protein [Fibromonadaceae bacterium]
MRQITFPNWLVWIDENFKWLSIPKLPLVLIIIQALGFLLDWVKPFGFYIDLLAPHPHYVFKGEIWRIFTFIAIPFPNHLLLILVLWFFYDFMVLLEESWGSMFLTVYFIIAWLSTVFAAFLNVVSFETIAPIFYIECSFVFALATLNPNKELHLFFILPIAFKWIALFIAGILIVVPCVLNSYSQLIYVILLFVNYLLFFGKDYWIRFRKELDKRKKA